MPGWFGARAKKLLEDDDNDAGGYMPVIAEAVPRPPDGRDINASISPGERKGIWLLMVSVVGDIKDANGPARLNKARGVRSLGEDGGTCAQEEVKRGRTSMT